jgi:hypothetical protein
LLLYNIIDTVLNKFHTPGKHAYKMDPSNSLFERLFGQSKPVWVNILVILLLLLAPILAAYLDNILAEFFSDGHWRAYLLTPAILIYIWLITPAMGRMEAGVVRSMREVVKLNDEAYDQLVAEASQVNPFHEGLACAVGIVLGILSAMATDIDQQVFWLEIYWFISSALMYGVLTLTIFIAISSTRLSNSLHRQPLRIDILDISPFEAIGRQSLLLALVFIGGITISLIFSLQETNITSLEFWLGNLVLIVITLTIFFLNMRPTHKVLNTEKKRELSEIEKLINQSARKLVSQLKGEEEAAQIAVQITALEIYERRLISTRTWPINTNILRTLVVSVFIPLLSVLARLAVDLLAK